MAFLTQEQIAKLVQIIRDASAAVAVQTTGYELPPEELKRLRDEGFITGEGSDLVLDSFAFGQLMVKQAGAQNMGYGEFSKYLKRNPVALSGPERRAYDVASRRAGQYCVGLGDRFSQTLGEYVVQGDAEMADRARAGIRETVSTAISSRETRKKLRSRLGNMTKDWARDWDRIASTEMQMAHEEGYFDTAVAENGEDVLLAKIPEPGACKHCITLYTDGGKPIVRPSGWWARNGVSNAGRKTADWKAVLGAIHPFCRCRLQIVPAGWGFDENNDLVPLEKSRIADSANLRKAGPFIGPKGGKWADPKHTIPYKEKEHHVTFHRKIFGTERKETFHVVKESDTHATLSRHKDSDGGITMPKESVKHFVNDLAGKVDLPKHGRKEIDAVVTGKAKLLGKGDDGIAFRVGDKVVKVSTTVPYQPENPGHRTPDQAADMLKDQVETGNKLADMGIRGVQRSEYIRHGDKGFQIKPWVEIPDKFTRDQLDKIQDTMIEVHKKGYAIRDDIQAGLDADGEPVMFDTGKAAPQSDATGIYSDVQSDMDNLKRLYRDNDQEFVRRDMSDGQRWFDHARSAMDRLMSKKEIKPTQIKMVERHLSEAVSRLKKEAQITLSGDRLDRRLSEIDDDAETIRIELDLVKEDLAKREGGEVKKADSDHKLAYQTTFQGFNISIENRKGSYRHWYDQSAKTSGKTKMLFPYGRIPRSRGLDGDAVDVYLGPDESATSVYVITQMKKPGFKEVDEQKCMMGFPTAQQAKAAYVAHYDDPRFFGSMKAIPVDTFRKKVYGAEGRMIKSGGPFVGPRGGKWADAEHTIPWHIQEEAHGAVKAEVIAAAKRAVSAGADPHKLEYVGAGGEGIVFKQGNKAFKVSRRGGDKLRMEAAAIEALSGHKNAPKFYGYDAANDVLIREHVEGRPGRWGDETMLRGIHDSFADKLKAAELTSPEFKADSYIIGDDGVPKLVDAGFVQATGSRAAADLTKRIEAAKPSEDAFEYRFDLQNAFSHGDIDHATALKLVAKIRSVFGGGLEQKQLEEGIAFTASTQKALMTPDLIKGWIRHGFDSETEWRKALDRVGIPHDKFHMIVKYARMGHAESREALDRVQQIIKSGIYHPSNRPETVGTMGNWGSPARTAGDNVRPGRVRDVEDLPGRIRKVKKIRRKRKTPLPGIRTAPAGKVGSKVGDGWANPLDLSKIVRHADATSQDRETVRQNLDRQTNQRIDLREGVRLTDPKRKRR